MRALARACVHTSSGLRRWTALHFAAANGQHDAIASLVKHGADPAMRNQRGQTPLGEAALYGQAAATLASAMTPQVILARVASAVAQRHARKG